MDQHDLFELPNDQELTAHNVMLYTHMEGEDPPTMKLLLDVTHDETKVGWRQSLSFTATKTRELTQLLVFTCEQLGIEWSPDGSSEEKQPRE